MSLLLSCCELRSGGRVTARLHEGSCLAKPDVLMPQASEGSVQGGQRHRAGHSLDHSFFKGNQSKQLPGSPSACEEEAGSIQHTHSMMPTRRESGRPGGHVEASREPRGEQGEGQELMSGEQCVGFLWQCLGLTPLGEGRRGNETG